MANASINQDEAYEKILVANLARTIDFLKFAEAKNAALLAWASAWIFGIVNLEFSAKTLPGFLGLCLVLALPFALCPGLLAMISFLPRLHLPPFLGGKRARPHSPNLLYFGDISALPLKTLTQDLRSRYSPNGTGHSEHYIHDLTIQLGVNSDITMRKMRLFSWGITLIFMAGLILLVPIIGIAFKNFSTL